MTTRRIRTSTNSTAPRYQGVSTLDLRQSILNQVWRAKSPRMARILTNMESVEDWVVDSDQDVVERLAEMSETLEHSDPNDLMDPEVTEGLSLVMCYITSSKAMTLMHWFDEQYQGSVGIRMIDQARSKAQAQPRRNSKDDNSHHQLLLERLQVLNSLNLLPEIFSPTRIKFVKQILRDLE